MRRAELRFALAALLAAGFAAPAGAACTVSVTGVAFGAYDTLSGSPDDSTGTISATCLIIDDAPDVEIDSGNAPNFSPRRMDNGGSHLNYNLYTSASRTIVWGDGTGGTQRAALTLTGTFLIWRGYSRTIYGRIPAGQNVSAGAYGDTLVVTMTF
jgi:spore coat protein U-like protein